MKNRLFALCLFASAGLLAACGGGGYGGGGSTPYGGGGGNPSPPPGVSANTIGFALPDGTIGTVVDPTYGKVGGYTQHVYSQTLAFPPGTVITLKNLSSSTPHTLNVLSTTAFPANPTLSTASSGTNTLDANYASGSIPAGGSVSVTLANAGTYYIGCAYHYMDAPNSMRDVLVVQTGAVPGPQATPPPTASGGGGGGGYCPGGYC